MRLVGFILGYLLAILAVAMLLPTLLAAWRGEDTLLAFAASTAITAFVSGLLVLGFRSKTQRLHRNDGFLLTALAWFVLPIFGALPFELSPLHLSLADALFESVSGITTTGSTVIAGLDSQPHSILLWRSILQWLGGIGIIAMGVAVLPFLKVGGMQLFRMESSDKSEKVVPRAGEFAWMLVSIYVGLSVLCAIAYAAGGMTVFEAINHAMTTLSTGGYSTSDGSMGHFTSPLIHWSGTLFMVLGGLPFVLYIRFLKGETGALYRDTQVQAFLGTILAVVLAIVVWLVLLKGHGLWSAVTHATFNVVSIVTTTGYASTDYSLWGTFAVAVFFFLTFIGGCSGSTAGGFKIYRYQIISTFFLVTSKRLIMPNVVVLPKYGEREVDDELLRSIAGFFFLFVATILCLSLILAGIGLDFVTSLTGAATAVANVGPGLGPIIGPAGNFAPLPDLAKLALVVGMLLGRLEIMSVFVLFLPAYWEKRSPAVKSASNTPGVRYTS